MRKAVDGVLQCRAFPYIAGDKGVNYQQEGNAIKGFCNAVCDERCFYIPRQFSFNF